MEVLKNAMIFSIVLLEEVLFPFCFLQLCLLALAGVAQWIECQTANQRVAGSIPSQGTCLGCRPGPQ